MRLRRHIKSLLVQIPPLRRYLAEKQIMFAARNEAVAERDAALMEVRQLEEANNALIRDRDTAREQLRSITVPPSSEHDAAFEEVKRLQVAQLRISTRTEFERDDFPDSARILFIGHATSSHTHSWLRLLDGFDINVRLFSPFDNDALPPEDFPVRTYMSIPGLAISTSLRNGLNATSDKTEWWRARDARLAAIIEEWRPHVVHTFGLFDAGVWWHSICCKYNFTHRPRWVLQLRGGSDLEINRFVPAKQRTITEVARAADQIISDNLSNFQYLLDLGIDQRAFASIAPVPGTGGMEVPAASDWPTPPSKRRNILWPKAYNSQFALALPVIEALKLAANDLPPCRIVMLWTHQAEVMEWIESLPLALRAVCDVRDRIPRPEVLALLRETRVLLAPSLVDGRPNTMFEAMVNGAFPIVSPLATIREVVKEPDNVLFARNLYPDEIAAALLKAMQQNELVERASVTNLELVRRVANRHQIRERVVAFYRDMVTRSVGSAT
jgi:glycosyltransferase involved in cell wall biosynthesis